MVAELALRYTLGADPTRLLLRVNWAEDVISAEQVIALLQADGVDTTRLKAVRAFDSVFEAWSLIGAVLPLEGCSQVGSARLLELRAEMAPLLPPTPLVREPTPPPCSERSSSMTTPRPPRRASDMLLGCHSDSITSGEAASHRQLSCRESPALAAGPGAEASSPLDQCQRLPSGILRREHSLASTSAAPEPQVARFRSQPSGGAHSVPEQQSPAGGYAAGALYGFGGSALYTGGGRLELALLHAAPLVWRKNRRILPLDHQALTLDFKGEVKALLDVLRRARKHLTLSSGVASSAALGEMLALQPLMLHLVCHGDIDEETGAFFLGFEDDEGSLDQLSLDRLHALLAPANLVRGTRLVFVSACHSQPAAEVFAACGVPHVVGVRADAKVLDDAAALATRCGVRIPTSPHISPHLPTSPHLKDSRTQPYPAALSGAHCTRVFTRC